ncbi:MAG TPA: phage tail length tape measure family protein [Rhizobiaceae bacterium]|nr:phage tail length tape measure family protein [Rhizobiaceae bacterium]
MTVQLSALRVAADLDPSRYVAGMNQKIAADKAGAASSREVGNAISQTDSRLSTASTGIERLMRQTVQGYSASQSFERALRTLQRALDTGNVTQERAEQILIGLNARYNLTANAADLMAAGQHQLAAAVTNANAALAAQETQVHRVSAANDNWRRNNLRMQMFDVGQMLALGQNPMLTLLQQGPQIAQIYAGQGGVKAALQDTLSVFGRFGPIVLAAMTVATGATLGLMHEIRQTSGVAVSFGNVVEGVFESIGEVIYETLKPAIDAVAPWFQAAWNLIISGVKWVGNAFVKGWQAQIATLEYLIGGVPEAFIIAGENAANNFLTAIEEMAQEVIVIFNGMIAKINGGLRLAGFDKQIPDFGNPEDLAFGRVDIGGADARRQLEADRAALLKRYQEIANSDPMGSFYDRIVRNSVEAWGEDQKKKKGPRERQSDFDRELENIQDRIVALKAERDTIGMTEAEAARLTITRKLEAAAMKDSIGLSPERVAAIQREADAYATITAEIEKARKAQEYLDLVRDTFKGFISDLRDGLRQGESFWDSFRNAATRAMDTVADKLLNDVMDAIFQVKGAAGGGLGGGGGGILGGILGWVGNLFGGGGVSLPGSAPIPTPRPAFASGTVGAPAGLAWVGERGPELVNFRGGERVYDNVTSMRFASNQNDPWGGQMTRIIVEIASSEDLVAVARQEGGAQAQVLIREYDKGSYDRHKTNHAKAKKRIREY